MVILIRPAVQFSREQNVYRCAGLSTAAPFIGLLCCGLVQRVESVGPCGTKRDSIDRIKSGSIIHYIIQIWVSPANLSQIDQILAGKLKKNPKRCRCYCRCRCQRRRCRKIHLHSFFPSSSAANLKKTKFSVYEPRFSASSH